MVLVAEALGQLGLKGGVAADGDGQVQAGHLEQPVQGFAGLGFAGVDDIEHLSAVTVAGSSERPGPLLGEDGADGEAESLQAVFRDAGFDQHIGRRFIGDDEQVAGSPIPRRAYADRVGHHGDEPEGAFGVLAEDVLNEMRINRVAGNHHIRLGVTQDGCQ